MKYVLSTHAQDRLEERGIREEWLLLALGNPALTLPDEEDSMLEHRLVVIEEHGKRVLRVVCNPHVHPIRIVTAHFDRSMKGKV
jgi:uncharacterized DUF497 family protein